MQLMRKRLFWVLFSLFLIENTQSNNAYASTQVQINEGVIVVEERTKLRDYLQAALQQVFVKTSGNTDVINNAAIKRSIANYEQYLISSRTQQKEDEVVLIATFNKQKIISLLDSLQLPVWSELRPAATVWMGYREDNRLQYASEINNIPFGRAISTAANKRGVDIILPVGDIEDSQTVTAYDVWSQNISRLMQQSSRYGSENFISLSISDVTAQEIESINNQRLEEYQLRLISAQSSKTDRLINASSSATKISDENDVTDDESLGLLQTETIARPEMVPADANLQIDYVIVTADETVTGKLFGSDPIALVASAIDKYANDLAQRFAVTSVPQGSGAMIGVTFNNIRSLKHLAEVEDLLNTNPMVRSVTLAKQQGVVSVFEVEIIDEARKLIEMLTIDSRVKSKTQILESPAERDDAMLQLDFRWEP